VKLKINHERISVTYKDVLDNIQELKELRALPDFLVIDDVGGCFGDDGCYCCGGGGSGGFVQNMVQLIMTNHVMCHKACRHAIDS